MKRPRQSLLVGVVVLAHATAACAWDRSLNDPTQVRPGQIEMTK